MKLTNILYYLAVIVFLTPKLWAANTNPVVTNVTFSITGTTVTVHYDVTDAEQSTVTIGMSVSSDGGATWNYNYGTAIGDIGASVATGTNKTITWTYSGGYNPNFKIVILADDNTADGSPCPGTETVLYSGKTYNTIQIGSQCWLKENLDVGTRINGTVEQTNNSVIEKYCYNDSPDSCSKYGGLYEWAEAVQYQNGATNTNYTGLAGNVQGICPSGWHIPTYAELQTLSTTVGGDGNSLKEVGQGTGSGAGTNTSGFSALLAGYRGCDVLRSFGGLGYGIYFRSSPENDGGYAYFVNLNFIDSNILSNISYKEYGYSVRCAKD
jgi:uncharacterized protein (TIGR02145 family)